MHLITRRVNNPFMEVYGFKDKKHIQKEKAKARELRSSQWWKQRISHGICHYCEEKTSPKELTMDHLTPVSRGGRSTKGNVVPSCKECNSKKKYYTPAELLMMGDGRTSELK